MVSLPTNAEHFPPHTRCCIGAPDDFLCLQENSGTGRNQRLTTIVVMVSHRYPDESKHLAGGEEQRNLSFIKPISSTILVGSCTCTPTLEYGGSESRVVRIQYVHLTGSLTTLQYASSLLIQDFRVALLFVPHL